LAAALGVGAAAISVQAPADLGATSLRVERVEFDAAAVTWPLALPISAFVPAKPGNVGTLPRSSSQAPVTGIEFVPLDALRPALEAQSRSSGRPVSMAEFAKVLAPALERELAQRSEGSSRSSGYAPASVQTAVVRADAAGTSYSFFFKVTNDADGPRVEALGVL
jgi:hypothetical protein